MSLLVPRLDVTLQGEIEVPIAEFKCKTAFKSTTPLLEDTTHFKMQLIKAVGTKGEIDRHNQLHRMAFDLDLPNNQTGLCLPFSE